MPYGMVWNDMVRYGMLQYVCYVSKHKGIKFISAVVAQSYPRKHQIGCTAVAARIEAVVCRRYDRPRHGQLNPVWYDMYGMYGM